MKHSLITPLVLAVCISGASLQADEAPKDPNKQTTWGLYVDSKEVAEMKQKLGDKMLFVDVRDPIEIMFTGFTDAVDINIPFKIANRSSWHKKKPVFEMKVNTNFEQDLEAALKSRGLGKDAPIAIMCRSGGTRGAPATKLLENKGYKNIYVVTDGFEGGTVKKGEKKNWRLKNGWKNTGLSWSYKLNKEKMYMPEFVESTANKGVKNVIGMDKKAAFMPVVKHTSPMPNYMRTLKKNSDILELSSEQETQLKKWASENSKKATATVKRIVELENNISYASMHGDSKELLMKKFSEMTALRLTLASSKTACRDNMRSILSEKQWTKLVGLQVNKAQEASL